MTIANKSVLPAVWDLSTTTTTATNTAATTTRTKAYYDPRTIGCRSWHPIAVDFRLLAVGMLGLLLMTTVTINNRTATKK